MNDSLIKTHTLDWIRIFVIEYNICPFARFVFENQSLCVHVSQAMNIENALEDLMSQVLVLNDNPKIETTLLVLPNFLDDFYDYLDFLALSEELLISEGYEGEYQLASFHPKYCFAGVERDDVTNYTNRSPYPMIHILREASIEKAITHFGNTDRIPDDNMNKMRELGMENVKKIIVVREL